MKKDADAKNNGYGRDRIDFFIYTLAKMDIRLFKINRSFDGYEFWEMLSRIYGDV